MFDNINDSISNLIISADNIQGDRECILKDHTADPLEVVEVIDKCLKRSWNTEKIQLTIFHDGWRDGYNEHDIYIPKLHPVLRYVYEIDRLYTDTCPPLELSTLIIWTLTRNELAFYAFLWYCERCVDELPSDRQNTFIQSVKDYTLNAAEFSNTNEEKIENANGAARAINYAFERAYWDKDYKYWKRCADINAILFLRRCLGENQP